MLLTEELLMAVRDILRDNLTGVTESGFVENKRSIRITDDKRVPSYAGEEFINLYGSTVENEYDPIEMVRKESYSLQVGITRRLTGIPTDTSAETIYTYDEDLIRRTKKNMVRRAYQIIQLIDGQWGIPALISQAFQAEEESDDDEVFCFDILSPLGFLSSSPLEEVYAEHFRLEDDGDRPQALFLELSFGGLAAYFTKVGYNPNLEE